MCSKRRSDLGLRTGRKRRADGLSGNILDELQRICCGINEKPNAYRVSLGAGRTSTRLLGQADDDALRPADVSQSVRIPVLHFANDLGAPSAHMRDDGIDVVDGEHDTTVAK